MPTPHPTHLPLDFPPLLRAAEEQAREWCNAYDLSWGDTDLLPERPISTAMRDTFVRLLADLTRPGPQAHWTRHIAEMLATRSSTRPDLVRASITGACLSRSFGAAWVLTIGQNDGTPLEYLIHGEGGQDYGHDYDGATLLVPGVERMSGVAEVLVAAVLACAGWGGRCALDADALMPRDRR